MTEQAASSGTGTRVLTAVILVPLVVAIVWWGPTWLIAICVGVVTLLALREFFQLGERAGLRGYALWTGTLGVCLAFVQWYDVNRRLNPPGLDSGGLSLYAFFFHVWFIESLLVLFVLLFVLGVAINVVLFKNSIAQTFHAISISAAALLFVSLPLTYLIRLLDPGLGGRSLDCFPIEPDKQFLLFTLCVVWVGDTLAYFTGRALGRHKLAPNLSPGKTWEGAFGNVLGACLVAGVFVRWIPANPWHLAGAAISASIAGQIGDLLESAYKRSAGVKDSGTLLPGHGGVLDRIDALIFAAPAVWAYLSYVAR